MKLEDIEKVIQERRYSYQRFIDNQSKRISKKDSVIHQKQSEESSTDAPNAFTQIDFQQEEKSQKEKTESTVFGFDSVKSQETDLPDLSEFSESEFPFMFNILRKELAEKDKQLQQLQKEYEKVVTSLLNNKPER